MTNKPPFSVPHSAPMGYEKDVLRVLRSKPCAMGTLHLELGPEVHPVQLGKTVYDMVERGWLVVDEGPEGAHVFSIHPTPKFVVNAYSYLPVNGKTFPVNSYSTSREDELIETVKNLIQPLAGIDKIEILLAVWDQDRYKGQNVVNLDEGHNDD
jgi:hypothetical protein